MYNKVDTFSEKCTYDSESLQLFHLYKELVTYTWSTMLKRHSSKSQRQVQLHIQYLLCEFAIYTQTTDIRTFRCSGLLLIIELYLLEF